MKNQIVIAVVVTLLVGAGAFLGGMKYQETKAADPNGADHSQQGNFRGQSSQNRFSGAGFRPVVASSSCLFSNLFHMGFLLGQYFQASSMLSIVASPKLNFISSIPLFSSPVFLHSMETSLLDILLPLLVVSLSPTGRIDIDMSCGHDIIISLPLLSMQDFPR
ncbi:hypothetical protein PX690_21285 [Bacillus velezensis]|nr:hypothetical protein [Bacillus velezensis]WES02010.1 hypothetical protein PX690_21285 [Bacillus velezensis]